MKKSLADILNEFEKITLEEMDSVKLMNRTDTKFLFRREQLPLVLEKMHSTYSILDINGVRASRYETLYFDTEDFKLFDAHQCGRLNRYKVRHRKYVGSNLAFFEVKFKSNKGKTIKERVKAKSFHNAITGKYGEFLAEVSPLKPLDLKPVLWVNYTRITLVNNFSKERLTLDIDLEYRNGDKVKKLDTLVIAEVKQERVAPSPFIRVVRSLGVREGGISKYCFGIIFMYPHVRMNNFKPKLINLTKILAA